MSGCRYFFLFLVRHSMALLSFKFFLLLDLFCYLNVGTSFPSSHLNLHSYFLFHLFFCFFLGVFQSDFPTNSFFGWIHSILTPFYYVLYFKYSFFIFRLGFLFLYLITRIFPFFICLLALF